MPGLPWTSRREPFPFADFAFYPAGGVDHRPVYTYVLSPESPPNAQTVEPESSLEAGFPGGQRDGTGSAQPGGPSPASGHPPFLTQNQIGTGPRQVQ